MYDLTPRHTLQVNVVAGRSRYDEHADDPSPNSLEIGRIARCWPASPCARRLSPRLVVTSASTRSQPVQQSQRHDAVLDRGSEDDLSYRADMSVDGTAIDAVRGRRAPQRLHATATDRGYNGTGELVGPQTAFSGTYARIGAYGCARCVRSSVTVAPGRCASIAGGSPARRGRRRGSRPSSCFRARSCSPQAPASTGRRPRSSKYDGPQARPTRAPSARSTSTRLGQQAGPYRWQVTGFSRTKTMC